MKLFLNCNPLYKSFETSVFRKPQAHRLILQQTLTQTCRTLVEELAERLPKPASPHDACCYRLLAPGFMSVAFKTGVTATMTVKSQQKGTLSLLRPAAIAEFDEFQKPWLFSAIRRYSTNCWTSCDREQGLKFLSVQCLSSTITWIRDLPEWRKPVYCYSALRITQYILQNNDKLAESVDKSSKSADLFAGCCFPCALAGCMIVVQKEVNRF